MGKRSFYKGTIYSSLVMPNAYFNTALILADYIENHSGPYWHNSHNYWKKYDDSITEMINPLLYNLKHWIELFCKTFINLWKDEFNDGHNIKDCFTEFKALCLDLSNKNKIQLNTTDLKKIEKIINRLYNKDPKNDIHRYPNTEEFLIWRQSKKPSLEIKNVDYIDIERERIDLWGREERNDFLYKNEFSFKIPNICNEWSEWEAEIDCAEKIKKIIIELRNFFENVWRQKYFEDKMSKE